MSALAKTVQVATAEKSERERPKVLGVELSAQLVLLALSAVMLTALIVVALVEWAGRS
jgi:hypothetical protein